MDGVSTACSLVSSGYKVFKKVKALRKAIKDAPEKLQSLDDSCILLEQLLENLRRAESHLPTSINAQLLDRLSGRVQRGLDEVEKIVDKVTKGRLDDDDEVLEIRISRIKWIWYKEDFESIERELNGLRDVLSIWTQQTALELIIINKSGSSDQLPISCGLGSLPRVKTICDSGIAQISDDQDDDCGASHATATPPVALDCSRSKDPLQCPPQCKCRCHYPSVTQLVPESLASYVGQLTISKRLLHPTFSPWSLCNVQTCRGDFKRAATVRWILPFRILRGFLESRKDCRIHFSIGAPRVVPWDSPILGAVFDGDFQGVRNLFATGKASIWDYTVDGLPVFRYACDQWQDNPTEQHLEIIRLFTEAGAEAVLLEGTGTTYSAHDALTAGFFTYLLGKTSDASQSLATIVRTNTAAIDIFHSILNMDPMDALEDYLDRTRAQCMDVAGFMESLEDTRCDSENRLSVFEAINCTPLEYAIYLSPESVESLLSDGEDAALEPTLVYAVNCGRPELIKPLLDAGADINMRDWRGHTVLLEACSRCDYSAFLELLRWAEDGIGWDAFAVDGRNALELFDSAVSAKAGNVTLYSQSQINEFRAALVARMEIVEDESGSQLDMPGAFPDVPYT